MTDLLLMFEECCDLLPGPLRTLDGDDDPGDIAMRIVAAMSAVIMTGPDHDEAAHRLRRLSGLYANLADTLEGKAPPQK